MLHPVYPDMAQLRWYSKFNRKQLRFYLGLFKQWKWDRRVVWTVTKKQVYVLLSIICSCHFIKCFVFTNTDKCDWYFFLILNHPAEDINYRFSWQAISTVKSSNLDITFHVFWLYYIYLNLWTQSLELWGLYFSSFKTEKICQSACILPKQRIEISFKWRYLNCT